MPYTKRPTNNGHHLSSTIINQPINVVTVEVLFCGVQFSFQIWMIWLNHNICVLPSYEMFQLLVHCMVILSFQTSLMYFIIAATLKLLYYMSRSCSCAHDTRSTPIRQKQNNALSTFELIILLYFLPMLS